MLTDEQIRTKIEKMATKDLKSWKRAKVKAVKAVKREVLEATYQIWMAPRISQNPEWFC